MSLIVVRNPPFTAETTALLHQSVRALSPASPSALFGGDARLKHDANALHQALWRAVWALGRAMRPMHAKAGALLCDAARDGLDRCRAQPAPAENSGVERRWRQQRLVHGLLRLVMLGGCGCSGYFHSGGAAELRALAAEMEGAFHALYAATRAHTDPKALLLVASFIASLVPDNENEAGAEAMRKARLSLVAAC